MFEHDNFEARSLSDFCYKVDSTLSELFTLFIDFYLFGK